MENLPLVSIITPSLNQGFYIEETILSVLNQSYKNIEYIVVDGGSSDETLGILKKYKDKLSCISEPDQGQSDAINKGFRMANGEILAWINSDDFYEMHAIETVVKIFIEHPELSIVYGDCNYIYEIKNERKSIIFKAQNFNLDKLIQKGCYIAQPSTFFKRSILNEVGLLNLDLKFAMDYDLWIRIGKKGTALYIPQVLSNFRFSDTSKSGSQKEQFWPETRNVSLKHGGAVISSLFFDHYIPLIRKKIRL